MDDFTDQVDLPMVAVGAAGPDGARLWARAPGAAAVEVELSTEGRATQRARVRTPVDAAADHTVSFRVPDDAPGLDPLAADREHHFRVFAADGGALVGEGRFRTALAEGASCGRFAFALASCHQPFDDGGSLVPDSVRMLESVERALDAHGVRFLLLMGDQIYSDAPAARSLMGPFFARVAPAGRTALTGCTPEEVRRLYQARHRIFFGVEAFRRLQSRFASYPMLDDHEVVDNFGSAPEHAGDEFGAVRAGARAAIHDYQLSRVLGPSDPPPASFHYGFVNGPVAVFVMDVRSERRTDESAMRVYSDAQLEDLQLFLATHAERPVLALVVTVPIVHLERWLAGALTAVMGEASDAADRWANPKAIGARNRLLDVLRAHQWAHPGQRLLVLAGDIHVGCLVRVDWSDGSPSFHQFTSSALSNTQIGVARFGAERLLHTVRKVEYDGVEGRVELVKGAGKNPYGGLNLGIVEVEVGEATRLRCKLIGAPDRGGEARVVFDSGPL